MYRDLSRSINKALIVKYQFYTNFSIVTIFNGPDDAGLIPDYFFYLEHASVPLCSQICPIALFYQFKLGIS